MGLWFLAKARALHKHAQLTNGLNDGVLDNLFITLLCTGVEVGAAVRALPVTQFKIHAQAQMLQQCVKHFQNSWACTKDDKCYDQSHLA